MIRTEEIMMKARNVIENVKGAELLTEEELEWLERTSRIYVFCI